MYYILFDFLKNHHIPIGFIISTSKVTSSFISLDNILYGDSP